MIKRTRLTTLYKQYMPSSLTEWMVLLLILIFFAVRNVSPLLYGGQLLAFGTILWVKKSFRKWYTLVWLALIAWAAATYFWAVNTPHYLEFMGEVIQVGTLCVILYTCCDTREKIEKYLRFISMVSLIMIVYFVIRTPKSDWSQAFHSTATVNSSQDRFGRSIGLHPNSMGKILVIQIGCWLYQWRQTGKKGTLLWTAALAVLLLFTKSRAAIAFLGIMAVAYIVLEKRSCRKALSRVLLVAGGVFLVLWLVMNVPALYKLVGYRISGVMAFLTGEGTVDASVTGREKLISAGWEIIRTHPLFGVGARNFSNVAYANYDTWTDVYAHSNIIEIWSDLGIVGLLIYYVPRFWCLARLLRRRTMMTDPRDLRLAAFFAAFLIANIITDYFYMSYSSETIQILFTFSFAYCMLPVEEGVREPEKERVNVEKPCHCYGL